MASQVFKLLTKPEWIAFQKARVFRGTTMDKVYGFIHLSSTKEQVDKVKSQFYPDEQVCMLTINAKKLDKLKFESNSSGGTIYPHQYGTIKLDQVLDVELLDDVKSEV